MANKRNPLRKVDHKPSATKQYNPADHLQVGNPSPAAIQENGHKLTAGNLTVQQSKSFYSGPLPQPMMLEQYERTLPGSAERIFAMAEREAEHIRQIDLSILQAQRGDNQRGQWLAFGVCLLMSAVGITALFLNHPITTSIVCGTTLTSVVAVFITGRATKNKQDDKDPNPQTDNKLVGAPEGEL